MAIRQRVAADLGIGGGVVHIEDRTDRLVLEPLARITGMDAGPLGQLGRGRRAFVGQ